MDAFLNLNICDQSTYKPYSINGDRRAVKDRNIDKPYQPGCYQIFAVRCSAEGQSEGTEAIVSKNITRKFYSVVIKTTDWDAWLLF